MIATLSFFHFSIQRKIMGLALSPEIEKTMFEVLIPVFYLRHAANKAKKADARSRLKMKSDEILSSCRSLKDTFIGIAQEELEASISSKGIYDAVEDALWGAFSSSDNIERKAQIRTIGKRFYGVDKIEQQIYAMHPKFFVKTEGKTLRHVLPFRMLSLKQHMETLRDNLAHAAL